LGGGRKTDRPPGSRPRPAGPEARCEISRPGEAADAPRARIRAGVIQMPPTGSLPDRVGEPAGERAPASAGDRGRTGCARRVRSGPDEGARCAPLRVKRPYSRALSRDAPPHESEQSSTNAHGLDARMITGQNPPEKGCGLEGEGRSCPGCKGTRVEARKAGNPCPAWVVRPSSVLLG
jgi:hypothetical protein